MAYRVSVAGFEGPFDLLLQLVMRQKIDIGTVSVSAVADQYLAEVASMPDVDLEVASDFVLVAATLLDLKAAVLVQGDPVEDTSEEDFDDGYEDLTADEFRAASDLFDDDIAADLDPEGIARARTTYGGTGHSAVAAQLEEARAILAAAEA